jgi:hypothetical protein
MELKYNGGVRAVFANRFKGLRAEKGYTQKDVADLLGISPTAVASWEQERNNLVFLLLFGQELLPGGMVQSCIHEFWGLQCCIGYGAP